MLSSRAHEPEAHYSICTQDSPNPGTSKLQTSIQHSVRKASATPPKSSSDIGNAGSVPQALSPKTKLTLNPKPCTGGCEWRLWTESEVVCHGLAPTYKDHHTQKASNLRAIVSSHETQSASPTLAGPFLFGGRPLIF